jgi:ABC-type lipopolysaccharide export system ATPase subunit
LIPSVAKERASAGFIFTHFNVDDSTGIHDKAYILAVGLLMSQYSVIGYDASAHMVNCPAKFQLKNSETLDMNGI